MKKPQAKKPISKPKPKAEPSMASVAAAQPPRDPKERQYRAEDALRTLQRAEEIKADKSLMADVHAQAHKQVAAISKITSGSKPKGRTA